MASEVINRLEQITEFYTAPTGLPEGFSSAKKTATACTPKIAEASVPTASSSNRKLNCATGAIVAGSLGGMSLTIGVTHAGIAALVALGLTPVGAIAVGVALLVLTVVLAIIAITASKQNQIETYPLDFDENFPQDARASYEKMRLQLIRDIKGSDMKIDNVYIDDPDTLLNRADLSLLEKFRIMCWLTQGGKALSINQLGKDVIQNTDSFIPAAQPIRTLPPSVNTKTKIVTIQSELRLQNLDNNTWKENHSYLYTIEYNYENNTIQMKCSLKYTPENWGVTPELHTIARGNNLYNTKAARRAKHNTSSFANPLKKLHHCLSSSNKTTNPIGTTGMIMPPQKWEPTEEYELCFEEAYAKFSNSSAPHD